MSKSGIIPSKSTRSNRVSQRGAVFVFVSVAVLVLVMFVAYVVDINALVLSKEEGQHYARVAALAAIEEYFASECEENESESACFTRKIQKAETRANTVSLQNRMINSNVPLEVKYQSSDPAVADLIPGKWVAIETEAECGGNPPCFVPLANGEYQANAFKVSGAFGGGIRSFLSRNLFGTDKLHFSASSIATVVPRRGCFLIDISGSVTRETHLRGQSGAVTVGDGEYSYYTNGDNPSTGSAAHQARWNALGAVRGNNPTVPTVHYKDDYVDWTQVEPMSDSDYPSNGSDPIAIHHPNPSVAGRYSVGSADKHYRVDAFRSNTGTAYRGPEPLTTIIEGIRTVIETFKERAVSGDKACIIFYDKQVTWPRVVIPTNDFDYILSLLDTTVAWVNGSVPPALSSASGFYKSVRHWIFPVTPTYTNSRTAIGEALGLLAEDAVPGVVTADFIVMIGDGQTNCYDDSGASGGYNCANDYNHYSQAMTELKTFVTDYVVPAQIPINVLLVGVNSGPHTVDIAVPNSTPLRCYTDAEMRALGIAGGAVQGGIDGNSSPSNDDWNTAYRDQSAATPFFQASKDMYEIALMTKGVWAPIRPSGNNCTPSPSGGGELPSACNPNAGRKIYDPYCRSVADQINAAMDTIMGQNPYTVVSVD